MANNKGEMQGWGGSWNWFRETFRGLFHQSPGIIGFLMLTFWGLSTTQITLIFIAVAIPVMLAEYARHRLNQWLKAAEPEKLKAYRDLIRWMADGDIDRLAIYFSKRTLQRIIVIAQYLNDKVAPKIISRPSEKHTYTAMGKSVLGFGLAWIFCAFRPEWHWIAAQTCLYFAFVDTFAKFGHLCPVRLVGWKNTGAKSWGGFCFGWLAAMACVLLVVIFHQQFYPILPAEISIVHFIMVANVGAATASFAELLGGKWDNFWIPASATPAMLCTHIVLNIF